MRMRQIPPEVRSLQDRQSELERRIRFIEARLGIVHPAAIQDFVASDGNNNNHPPQAESTQ